MSDELPTTGPNRVADLIDRTELRDVRLISISGHSQDRPVPNASAAVSMEDITYRTEPGSLLVRLMTDVHYYEPPGEGTENGELDVEKPRTEVGRLQLVHVADLSLEGDLDGTDQDQIGEFLAGNIIFMLFPYVRAAIQRYSADLMLPTTVLPYLRRLRAHVRDMQGENKNEE